MVAQRVRRIVLAGTRRTLAIVGVAATPADREALQQPVRAGYALALALPVLFKLCTGRLEYGEINKWGTGISIHSSGGTGTRQVARGEGCG